MSHAAALRERVKLLLEQSGKKREDFARALDYKSKSSATGIIQGKQNLPPSRYDAAARFFGLSLEEFLAVEQTVQPGENSLHFRREMSHPDAPREDHPVEEGAFRMTLTGDQYVVIREWNDVGAGAAMRKLKRIMADRAKTEPRTRGHLQHSRRK